MPGSRALVLLMFAAFVLVRGKRKNQEKIWKKRKKLCEQETCADLNVDERMNCVNYCISDSCFGEVFGDTVGGPLEDGEIDTKRNRRFMTCVRGEARIIHQRKVDRSHHYDRKAAEAQELEDEEEEDMEEILAAEAEYEMEQIGEQEGQEM